jgi:thiamine transport system substrate-binding protein
MRRIVLVSLALALTLAACGSQGSGAPTSAPAAAVPTSALAPTTAEAPTGAPVATSAPDAAAPTSAPDAASTTAPAASGAQLVVMSHDSFNVSEDVLTAFEQQSGATVQILKSGDAGAALNKAILSKDNPLADIFFGVDNTFLTRALASGIFEPYPATALGDIPPQFKLDPSNQLLPIDYGYVTINYDKAALQAANLQPPGALEELTKPEWKDKLVVENPATSSPGLAFLLATVGHFGTSGSYTWVNYWQDLKNNGVLVSDGWEDAYYTQFSGSSGKGPRPLVVSYGTSPAAEVFFSEGKLTAPPTGNLDAGSFLQVEFAGILKGTKQRALAEQFLDFMLSKRFQEDIPLQMFVYPVLPSAGLPEVFTQFAQAPKATADVAPEQIDQNREQWIDTWTKTVLR